MEIKNDSIALGIDLGGTKILTAISDQQGTLLSSDHCETPAENGPEAVLQAIDGSVASTLQKASLDIDRISAIGIGAPGPSNPKTGVLHTSPNLPGWHDVPIRNMIKEEYGKRTFLVNDANAAALAEYHFGVGRGSCCLLYVTVSTGIGGGIVINGEIYAGAHGTAAEIGHMTVSDKGPRCNCGNTGCWEALCSGTALAGRARDRIESGEATDILSYAEGDVNNVTARVVGRAAQGGDALALRLVGETAQFLGIGLANLINILNPDVIVLGGGLIQMGRMLLEPALTVARQRAFNVAFESVRIETATLGKNSGVLGAAIHAFQQIDASEK